MTCPDETPKWRILHLDDDEPFLSLTEEFLSRGLSKTEILTTTCVEQARAWLNEYQIDCVVSDYEMPEADGLTFLQTVRDHDTDLPFILYTGKGSEEIASRAVNAGVTGYLQKGGAEQHRRLSNRVEHAINEYRSQIESERYSTVLDALGYPVYVVGADGCFEYINQEFVELVGYDRETLIGAEPAIIKSDDSVTRIDDALSRVVSSDSPNSAQVEVRIQPREGRDIPCRDHIAALPFETEYRGCAGILRNISEQRRDKQELVNQNERLEELVSVISHDLKTPLTTADTALSLAEETGEQEFFERANRAHERADAIIEEVLTLTKEGEQLVTTDAVAIETVAEEAWETSSRGNANLSITTNSIIEGDPSRLQRLFENLFANAIEHGTTTTRSEESNETEHENIDVNITVGSINSKDTGFYVADNGPGIPTDERDLVFQPGFTTIGDGTGFGLAIVDRIANAHGWEVQVTESKTGGARFEFTSVIVIDSENSEESSVSDESA
jgi:PAS domain S-box-containing protein